MPFSIKIASRLAFGAYSAPKQHPDSHLAHIWPHARARAPLPYSSSTPPSPSSRPGCKDKATDKAQAKAQEEAKDNAKDKAKDKAKDNKANKPEGSKAARKPGA